MALIVAIIGIILVIVALVGALVTFCFFLIHTRHLVASAIIAVNWYWMLPMFYLMLQPIIINPSKQPGHTQNHGKAKHPC